jgi:hypothetical protein
MRLITLQGAKRSRPPPDLGKQKEQPPFDPNTQRGARLKSPEPMGVSNLSQTAPVNGKIPVIVEEVSDEDNEPSPKKSKPNGVARPLQPAAEIADRSAPTIVELADKETPSQSMEPKTVSNVVLPAQIVEPGQKEESPTSSVASYNPFALTVPGPKSALGIKSSAPKAPSKLRYSIQAEKDDSPKESGKELPSLGLGFPSSRPSASVPSVPTPASAPGPTPTVSSTIAAPTTSLSTLKETKPKTTAEIKAFVLTLPEDELPKYTFGTPLSTPGAGPSIEKAKAAAMAVPLSALPMFDFAAPVASSATTSRGNLTSSAPATTSAGFNWAAAGLKQPSKPADNWDCSVCGLSNPPAATSKCQVCEASKPGAESATSTSPAAVPTPPPAPVSGFNWSAAGMKMSLKPADNWDCSVCGLSNPPSATSKCQVCEAPKPGAESTTSAPPAAVPTPPPAPVSGFNWSAAGMKMPLKPADNWDCSVCGLSNPPAATSKCQVCEAPKPGAVSTTPTPPAAVPTPPSAPISGFNWAAAGMKLPTATAGWKCSTCMLDNPDSVSKCTVCESPR